MNTIKQSKFGMCPIMSSTQVIPVPKSTGQITAVGKQEFVMTPTNAMAECVGDNCQLFVPEQNMCSYKLSAYSDFDLKENLRDLNCIMEPCSEKTDGGGNSYADALNSSISKLTYLVENLFKNIKS